MFLVRCAISFPPIEELSDEGEQSESDYDYRLHGVVKHLGRTDLEDDSDESMDNLNHLCNRLTVKSKDSLEPRATSTLPFHHSNHSSHPSFPSHHSEIVSATTSPASQRLSPQSRRRAQETSNQGNRLATQHSPDIKRRSEQPQSVLD